jgi:signal transduction histidine kinase
VRVPLNTIRLGIDSIQQRNNFDSESNAVVSCMDEAVNTMSGTLDDVLSYQKIEEGKVELELRPFVVQMLFSATRNCNQIMRYYLRNLYFLCFEYFR